MYPLTRKNLGGVAVDSLTRVLQENGTIVTGIYAVGELTGMAGLNGEYGMSGTFLGPSVFMGRVAAKTALKELDSISGVFNNLPNYEYKAVIDEPISSNGYWHYKESHKIIKERKLTCTSCHKDFSQSAMLPGKMRISQLESCTKCH
jgi:hypothetical protein